LTETAELKVASRSGKLLASRVDLLLAVSQTSGVSRVSRSTCLPERTSRAMAVPTPPMTAGLVTAAPGEPSSSCWMNWMLSAPPTGTGG
jgi:hypothetical protein